MPDSSLERTKVALTVARTAIRHLLAAATTLTLQMEENNQYTCIRLYSGKLPREKAFTNYTIYNHP